MRTRRARAVAKTETTDGFFFWAVGGLNRDLPCARAKTSICICPCPPWPGNLASSSSDSTSCQDFYAPPPSAFPVGHAASYALNRRWAGQAMH